MKWLVTGVAGFIGSHLLELLLNKNHQVIGIDNLTSGSKKNLNLVKKNVGKNWNNFTFIKDDITNLNCFDKVDLKIDIVVNLAAIVSVQSGQENPLLLGNVNINGHLNVLSFVSKKKIKKFVFASSSAVYGKSEKKNKETDQIDPISLYGLSKKINEDMTEFYTNLYSFEACGLRFFNVFGPRQKSDSQYSGVISKWVDAIIKKKQIIIYGNGEATRDFIYVGNVISAIFYSGISKNTNGKKFELFNVATGKNLTIKQLFNLLSVIYRDITGHVINKPLYRNKREGDIKTSIADTVKFRSNFKEIFFNSIDDYLYNILKDKYEK